MCVHMYVYAHMYRYVHVCTCMHICIYTPTNKCII